VLRQQYQPDLAIPDDMADLLGRIGPTTPVNAAGV